MRREGTALLALAVGAALTGCASSGVTNVGRALGYSIDYVDATPKYPVA